MFDVFPDLNTPRDFNAATAFIDHHVQQGAGERIAVIDDNGATTYAGLQAQVNRVGNALRALGLRQETRVAMIMQDCVRFPAVFWGAIKAGIIPIPLNTMLHVSDYRYLLSDSRAQAVIVSDALLDEVRGALTEQPFLEAVVVDGQPGPGEYGLADLLGAAESTLDAAPTTADDVAFWLYSSGSTGKPKGVLHLHSHLGVTAELYARGVLGIEADDVIFSAAKLFFAYGMGNGMTFPFAVGATAVYLAGRPTPEAIMEVMRTRQPTLYGGVPTLYAAILANESYNRKTGSQRLRRCLSAGEPLSHDVGARWEARFGAEILDGVGSTEMLHIYLSNRPGKVRYGTSGEPVPGYAVRLVDDDGRAVDDNEVGELLVNGPSAAAGYWNQRAKSLDTFEGRWMRTGDKYHRDDEGYYHYAGRADDMMKVSGQWVSPFEVEWALVSHEQVVESAVVPFDAGDGLIKPEAYVVLKEGCAGDDRLVAELQGFVKSRIAAVKYPRRISFVHELPKTATGKIQRFKLRGGA